jgi:hypothetical protein
VEEKESATAEVELLAHSETMFTGTGCWPQRDHLPADPDGEQLDRHGN